MSKTKVEAKAPKTNKIKMADIYQVLAIVVLAVGFFVGVQSKIEASEAIKAGVAVLLTALLLKLATKA